MTTEAIAMDCKHAMPLARARGNGAPPSPVAVDIPRFDRHVVAHDAWPSTRRD